MSEIRNHKRAGTDGSLPVVLTLAKNKVIKTQINTQINTDVPAANTQATSNKCL